MTLEPEPGRDLDPVANRWAGNTVGFEYSGFRVEQKPWWQNMKHDWTVDQWGSMICRRCDLRFKSKHEGEQHECGRSEECLGGDRCPASKSGQCLKSVSAAITDHPACVDGCEMLSSEKYLGGDRCPECGRPMVWAGMGWEPHSVSYHAWWREFLLTYLARMLKETRKVNQAGSWLRLESE